MTVSEKRAFIKSVSTEVATNAEAQMGELNKLRIMCLTTALHAEIAEGGQLDTMYVTAIKMRAVQAAQAINSVIKAASQPIAPTPGELP